METFMGPDFLLKTPTARRLYHEYAEKLPIYDYHCHINPQEIWENKRYENITQVWLYGDHYKWRIMRAMGIDEKYITGDASDYDKFVAYAKALSYAIGNPLYHWSHLELRRYFGIEETLSEKTAPVIWEKANAALQNLSCRDLIAMSNVDLIATTDEPISTLEYHQKIRQEGALHAKVVPAFRPDKIVELTNAGFAEYIASLSDVCQMPVSNLAELKQALLARIAYFHENGGRIADHGLDYAPYAEASEETVDAIFQKALRGEVLTNEERDQYRTHLLVFFGAEYAKRGWVMQLHMAAIRNNNSKLFQEKGPDVGNDAILDVHLAAGLAGLMDAMVKGGALPKTILYSLNPNHNYSLLTIGGCFAGEIPGKIQLGSAWWFNDHIDGMRQQMRTVANVGVLGKFIGMLTDSRSFLSYFRHEYFRRLVCDLVGDWVENGEYPDDEEMLKEIVEGICYRNAVEYFGIAL